MASRTAYSTWTPQKPTLFDGHYLRNRSTLDIGVMGYIDIVQHKEHSPKVLSIPPGTPCILVRVLLFSWLYVGRVGMEPRPTDSQLKNTTRTELLYSYSIPPDDGLQICPRHVEVDWSNKLRINSASSWFSLHRCIEMHGQQNMKFNTVTSV